MPARARASAREGEVLDGRIQRSVRSRQSIIDAMIALVEEGELQPTGQQVADRAGVGLRTVFRHFEDMETLFSELRERVESELRPQLASHPPARGSFEERLLLITHGRARVFERIAMFKRSERMQRWSSAVLQAAHTGFLRETREHLLESLPEIASLPPELQQSCEVVAGFEYWDLLRTDQGLGVARAEETVRETLRRLLAAGR